MAAYERPVSLRVRIRSLSSRPKLALGVAISNWQAGRQAGRQAGELAYDIRHTEVLLNTNKKGGFL